MSSDVMVFIGLLKKQWVSALSSMAKGAVTIGMDDKLMPKSRAEAYHCEKCKTVIIREKIAKNNCSI